MGGNGGSGAGGGGKGDGRGTVGWTVEIGRIASGVTTLGRTGIGGRGGSGAGAGGDGGGRAGGAGRPLNTF